MIMEVSYEEDSIVFEAGSRLENFVYILDGQLTYSGRKFNEKSFFMPIEEILGRPLKGSVVAPTRVTCLFFNEEDLQTLAERYPEVYRTFIETFLSVWAKMLRVHDHPVDRLAANAFAYFERFGKPSDLMRSAQLVLELVEDPAVVDRALAVIQRTVEASLPGGAPQLPDDEDVAYSLVLTSLSTDENPLDWMYHVFAFSDKFRGSERSAELLSRLLEKLQILEDRSAVESTISALMLRHPDSPWTARSLMSYSKFLKNRGISTWQDEVLRVLLAFPDSEEADEAYTILKEYR